MDEAARRRAVADRAGHQCEYCRSSDRFSSGPFSIEHIHPRTLGGSDDLGNLAWSCLGCNGHKGVATSAIDPVTGASVSLFHPRRMVWTDHFRWDDSNLFVIGLTPVGRATVERLQMNRSEIINLRSVLLLAGFHPPAEVGESDEGQ